MSDRAAAGQSGFTLIEVLVALAILGLSASALLRLAANGVERVQESEAEMAASALAQSLLARAGQDIPLKDGDLAGEEAGLKWRLRVSPYGSLADHQAWASDARQVSVSVSWGGAGRSVDLAGLRLLPEAP